MGQGTLTTIEVYQRKDKVKPFIRRWYENIFHQESTTLGTQTLKLTSDNKFSYSTSTHSLHGYTFGRWTKQDNTLILKADSVSGGHFLEQKELIYIIYRNRLYARHEDIKEKKWSMKRIE